MTSPMTYQRIHSLEREVALALKKAYECDGTSSRQHNEPAGFHALRRVCHRRFLTPTCCREQAQRD